MGDINSIGGIVKILEMPKKKIFNNNISVTQFRVQFPQIRTTQIVTLIFWGNLARDVANYYKPNDYILIEGYLSLRDRQLTSLIMKTPKKVCITVFKIYPFLLNYDRSISKI